MRRWSRIDAAVAEVPELIWDKVKEQQLIHRAGEARDPTGALSFLCSDDAAFVTGQTYHVDGGAVLSSEISIFIAGDFITAVM